MKKSRNFNITKHPRGKDEKKPFENKLTAPKIMLLP